MYDKLHNDILVTRKKQVPKLFCQFNKTSIKKNICESYISVSKKKLTSLYEEIYGPKQGNLICN
jgi:AAA+ ATPase superfamily predicted ATPase